MTAGLYVHIPFCVSKCHYCDFYSEQIKVSNVNNFLKGLELEVKLLGEMLVGETARPVSVYLGGGTPSVLSVEQLRHLVKVLERAFDLSKAMELSVEINPGSVTLDKLQAYQQLGINRLSVGVQSFKDDDLLTMGRKHRLDQVIELLEWINHLKFDNNSMDLIYGLPYQTLNKWEDNLNQAAKYHPRHISLYGLKLEEETHWGRLHQLGELTVPDDEHQAEMYLLAVSKLEQAGYNRYEISNFAHQGYESRHNLLYWQNQTYLGLGPGASSHYLGKRWTNIADIDEYLAKLTAGKLPIASGEELSPASIEAETIFLGLRLAEGLKIEEINKKLQIDFLTKYQKQLGKYTAMDLLEIADGRVKLSLRGVLLANEIFADFLPGALNQLP
ncbi:MAG: radical SAM family heme chaperone HemW [Clostridia bacterium]|nr:radical SAM family heme chaperone HemW [Clostridia bacterium]